MSNLKLSKSELKLQQHYSEKLRIKDNNLYLKEQNKERKPYHYNSMKEACQAVKEQAQRKKTELSIQNKTNVETLSVAAIKDILIQTKVGIVGIKAGDSSGRTTALAYYDYDNNRYTYDTAILNMYVYNINNCALSTSSHKQLVDTLEAASNESRFAIYNPPHPHEIPVKNGIYNIITKQLQPTTPEKTVISFIDTNYIKNAQHPQYPHAPNFDIHDILYQFSNYNDRRLRLLYQIFKACLINGKRQDKFFVILGEGGDGKSTIFKFLADIIGSSTNVSAVSFSEINDDNKIIDSLNKKLMIGYDNDPVFISKTQKLKSMSSNEDLKVSRKYLNPITAPFEPTIVQLCNDMPRFKADINSEWLTRRMVVFKAEYSHTKNGTADSSIPDLLDDEQLREYFLAYLLDEVPYYSDFEDVDQNVMNESLSDDDLINQFCEWLYENHIISELNTHLPTTTLYHLYLYWMRHNNPVSKQLGKKMFKKTIERHLENYGYQYSSARSRLSTLYNNKQFNLNILENIIHPDKRLDEYLYYLLEQDFGNLGSAENFFELNNTNLIHNNTNSQNSQITKTVHETTAIDYLQLVSSVIKQAIDDDLYNDIYEDIFKRKTSYQHINNDTTQQTLSSAFRSKDQQTLQQIKEIIQSNQLSPSELSYFVDEAKLISRIEKSTQLISSIELSTNSNVSDDELLLDFIDEYIDILDE